MTDIRTRQRQILEKRLEALWQDYEAAINQTTMALGAVEQNRANREAKDIYKQIEELDKQLKSQEIAPEGTAEASKPDIARMQLELRSKLPEIDFGALEQIIRKILRERQDEGCAALLLFQKSKSMGGEWCAARIREMIRRETQYGRFRHIQVKFQAAERVNAIGLLRHLGQYFNIEESAGLDRQGLSQRVIQKLCGSLQSGSIVLIECQRCDYFSRVPDEFHWVLEDFWKRTVSQLAAVAREYYEVKIIMSLFVDGTLPEGCLAVGQCCTPDHFQKDRLLEIMLEPWTREDIREWIARYSGLSLPRPEVDFMADKVYEAANGLPNLIAEQLLSECCPAVAG